LRRLTVNADDFGFTQDVNEGIVEAHRRGILTATTLMATGRAFDHAVKLAFENRSLDVGIHFVLIGGPSAVTGNPLPASVPALAAALAAGRIDPEKEFTAQAEWILSSGIRPLHADTHKHTHLLPVVRRALLRVASKAGIRFIRRPADSGFLRGSPLRVRLLTAAMRRMVAGIDGELAASGLRATDHFTGFALTGRYGVPDLLQIIAGLQPGVTELMTHPGFCREQLLSAPTRLKYSREQELQALTDPVVRNALAERNIQLTRYENLI
jgi:chitin disaccharide deacetylase